MCWQNATHSHSSAFTASPSVLADTTSSALLAFTAQLPVLFDWCVETLPHSEWIASTSTWQRTYCQRGAEPCTIAATPSACPHSMQHTRCQLGTIAHLQQTPTQLRTRQLTTANSQSHSIQLTPIPQHTATVCTATSTTQRSAHPSVVVVACHGYCGQLEAIPLSIGQDAEGKVNFADMLGSL